MYFNIKKRGQLDFPIISFFAILLMLIILAPIMMKIFIKINTSVGSTLGNMSNGGEVGQAAFSKVMNTAISFWDKVIISAFVLSILLLFLSSFMIDTNPLWVILYIFICFMLVLFAGNIVSSLNDLYSNPTLYPEMTYLPFLEVLINNFGVFLVGIIIVTGIIMYGKISLFGEGVRR